MLDTPDPTDGSEDEQSEDLLEGMRSLALDLSDHWEADEDDHDFTACSADDCGYCGHCSY